MQKIMTLVAALVCLFIPIESAAAHDGAQSGSYQSGFIIDDGTPCYANIGDEEPWTWLAAHTDVLIYTDLSQPWVFIGVYPDPATGSRNSCWVDSWGISAGRGEPPVNEAPPASEPGYGDVWAYINADGVNCRANASFDAEVLTQLVLNQDVVLIDEATDGWQQVGLEAYACYVSAQFISGTPVEETQVIAPDNPETEIAEATSEAEIAADAPEAIPMSAEAEITSITSLPSTGSGIPHSPIDIVPLLFFGITIIVVWVAILWCGRHQKGWRSSLKRVHKKVLRELGG